MPRRALGTRDARHETRGRSQSAAGQDKGRRRNETVVTRVSGRESRVSGPHRKRPRVLMLRTAGTNCDGETATAFRMAGAEVASCHVNELVRDPQRLDACQVLALPGGFTYGDDVASGKILANELRCKLGEPLHRFVNSGKLMIGICNGFQALVKAGFLPGTGSGLAVEATLTTNDSGRFEDRWVWLRPGDAPPHKASSLRSGTLWGPRGGRGTGDEKRSAIASCVWTRGIDRFFELPVAHGEGKFVARDGHVLERMRRQGQIVLRYVSADGKPSGYPGNPNGSVDDIAGICDATGRVLGLMPHPERHVVSTQHPRWTRGDARHDGLGDGLAIFRNGVKHAAQLL